MSPALKPFLERWLATTVGVLAAAHIVRGIDYETVPALLAASLVLGLLNAFLRPILFLLSLPLLIVTLGLFTLVINAGLLFLVGRVIKGFQVDGFWSAFWGALLISVISFALGVMRGKSKATASFRIRRGPPRQSKANRDLGSGPVIDV